MRDKLHIVESRGRFHLCYMNEYGYTAPEFSANTRQEVEEALRRRQENFVSSIDDEIRLKWLVENNAMIAYSRDDDYCWIHYPYGRDGYSEPENQENVFNSPNEAIDAAISQIYNEEK